MKIDLNYICVTHKGEKMTATSIDETGKTIKESLTFGVVINSSVLTQYPEDEKIDSSERTRRFMISKKVLKGDTQDFTEKEIDIIVKYIEKKSTIFVFGQLLEKLGRLPAEEAPAK